MKAVFVLAGLLALTSPTLGAAQSLGDVAARERARRDAIKQPARVITGDDLRAVPPPAGDPAPSAPLGSDPVEAAPARTIVTSARLQSGRPPQIPFMAVSGGEVVLEVAVGKDGAVTGATTLRDTPPFTDAVQAAVRGWRFTPAQDALSPTPGAPMDPASRAAAPSTVLVIGLFRPPGLFNVTLGSPPKTVAQPSAGAPALQSALTLPVYPAQALADGVVLVELQLTAQGTVGKASVVRSSPPFDQPALDAVKGLGFRTARQGEKPVPSTVYAAVAFRQPVTQ